MRRHRQFFGGLVVAVALSGLLAAPAAASAPANDPAAARFEVRFMSTMIDHHAMAIEMAELCPGRAVHRPLLEMCSSIVSAQSAEIADMQAWLSDWYGVSHTPTMRPGDERMLQMLAALSGPAFEVEFMESMIGHHWKAVVRASTCLKLAEHSELLGTCQNIITSQLSEIATLQSWLCTWYGECHYRAGLTGRA